MRAPQAQISDNGMAIPLEPLTFLASRERQRPEAPVADAPGSPFDPRAAPPREFTWDAERSRYYNQPLRPGSTHRRPTCETADMIASASVFLDLTPLSAATIFYFAAVLAVALFFKFNRLLSVRNLDVLTLFAVMPGLLLVAADERDWWGYLLLLCGSVYFFVRCLLDLVLVRRPALAPNLSFGGLTWLAGALFLGMAVSPPRPAAEKPNALPQTETPIEKSRQSVQNRWPESELGGWAERGLTLLCHLSIVVGLTLIGWRHFDDLQGGLAAATFYLLLPYAWLLLPPAALGSGRWDHALPMALMVWSVFGYRRPILAGALLGAAVGCVFFPVLTLPVWLSFYKGRGAGRFAGALLLTAALCLAVIGLVLLVNGEWPSRIPLMWTERTWQPWYESKDMPGFWVGVGWAYRIPVFIAYVAFVIATLFWPAPKNLAHVLALTAAHLIGIQFWYPDQGGVYVLWYLPFLLLLVFRPNLSACQPPAVAGDDWLARRRRALVRQLRKALRIREPEPVG
jgi:hypothetical protein